MSTDEMREYLISAQQQTLQNKILSAILTCFQNIKELEEQIIDIQYKVNEIIKEWNTKIEGVEDAEALNPEIVEDTPEEDIVDELTVPADSQSIEEVG